MNTRIYPALALFLFFIMSCNNNHLINDSDYLDKVNTDFLERKEMFSDKEKELFSVFDKNLNLEETEALKFLYAYMPLSDIADYSGSFFLDNIRLSLKVREETNRGGIPVPEYYIHFTLAKFEEGKYITLDYDYNKEISSFDKYLSRTPGKYMLVTGNRTDESKVLSSVRFFDLEPGERKTLKVELRQEMKLAEVLGEIDKIYYMSEGYRIGMGEQILKSILKSK